MNNAKMSAQLATNAKGLRAADIPLFQKNYDQYREAGMKLLDKKYRKMPNNEVIGQN